MNKESQESQVKPIKPKPSNERAWREGRRLQAWELHQQDPKRWTQQRIAEALGVTQGAVSQWLKAATQGGPQALLRRPSAGAPPLLKEEQLLQVGEWLQAEGGASAFGFVGEVWTCPRVANLIERRFGVKYHPTHVGRLLRKIGFTVQKPVKRANQRDEVAIEHWIKEEWPALKKNGR